MAIRNILKDDDPLLRKTSKTVGEFGERLHILLDDMRDTLIAADGAGLAAPQVGVLRRAVIVLNEDKLIELINPEITEINGEIIEPEGCLSIPGIFGTVNRPLFVKVRAQDRNGNYFEVSGEGMLARAFCHEIDHLNGILFTDKVIEYIDPEDIKRE
jgi:peptide deformylase